MLHYDSDNIFYAIGFIRVQVFVETLLGIERDARGYDNVCIGINLSCLVILWALGAWDIPLH